MYGNYCGPYWSDGKLQTSVCGSTEPVDEFDETCQAHDCAYALHHDLQEADFRFAKANLGKGPLRTAAGILVGTQGLLRGVFQRQTPEQGPNSSLNNEEPREMKKNLKINKRSAGNAPQPKQARRQAQPGLQTQLSTVPAAYGYSMMSTAPRVTRKANSATIVGSDYAGTVYGATTALYEAAASIPLNPSYFNAASLGTLARTYEKFRFRKAVVEYIPMVPTSTNGQLVMTSVRSIKQPFLDGSTSTFLSRALSQGNAVATPIWRQASLNVSCSDDWMTVDPLIDSDLDDSIAEEIQVYTDTTASSSYGILIVHYEIEFKDPLYTFHSTVSPIPIGIGSLLTCTDDSNVNAVGETIKLNNASLSLPGGQGAIFRLVFIQARSTLPVGPGSWSTLANVYTGAAQSDLSAATYGTAISMVPGTTFYAVLANSRLSLYSDVQAAIAGSPTGSIGYQTATTAAGVYAFLATMVRIGDALRVTTQ